MVQNIQRSDAFEGKGLSGMLDEVQERENGV